MADSVSVDVRRFWLSFVDPQRPEGDQFLGVAVVEVDEHEAAEALAIIDAQFPQHAEDAEWIAAASRKAWRMGCNPGGEVATADITNVPYPDDGELPLHRLMQQPELQRRGLI